MRKRHEVEATEPEQEHTVELINPLSMLFHFRLGVDECHRIRTGICSFDKPPASGEKEGGEAGVHYCQNLYANLQKYGFKDPHVEVVKRRCGHHEFSDGQHRVCIAKKKGLEIPATIHVEDSHNCEFCTSTRDLIHDELR